MAAMRSHVRLYLYALSTGCLVAVALLAACIVVDMRNADGVSGAGGWMVPGSPARRGELLMTELEDEAANATNSTLDGVFHIPDCAADDHCRGACRMVCSEMDWSVGPENHATTLMTFGCCEGAPIIMKQEQEPAARTMQLSQLAGGGARRRLMSSGGMLGDKHSLSADYAQLLKDEKSMQKRVAKLSVGKMLPYRGQQLRSSVSGGGGELAGQARENRNRPHVVTPGEDDFGTERQYTSQEGRPDRRWADRGRRCVGADCPSDDSDEFEDTLGQVTSRGTLARHNHPAQHRQHPSGSRGAMRRQPDPGLESFENPAEEDPADMTPEEFKGWLEQTNAGYAGADLYVQYERCTRRRSKSQCLKQIERSIERWEYRQRRSSRRERGRGRGRGGLVRTGRRGTGGANYQAVSRSVERTYGRDVGRGRASPDEVSRGLLNGHRPTDRSVRQYLGRNLYRAYMRERRNRNMYGTAHRQLRKGIQRVREAYNFHRAYNRSSYEHCLVMHRDDADFPRACMPLRDRIGRPWQSRNKDTTAPEDVLNGVMDGWWRFIGDDKHQLVGSVDDEAGVRHKNRFVEGEEPVPSKDYSTEDPAPWEKNRLVRDEPQHVEQKAMYAWDSAKLPGVNIDDWDDAIPTQFQETNKHPIAVTPHMCCAKYVDYSLYE